MQETHRRAFSAGAVLAVLVLLPAGPARAWEYPLLPHVQGLAFFPETPRQGEQTRALLSAYYPNECYVVVDSSSTDSAHVSVTIAPSTGCSDTVSTWTRMFNLGELARGMHDLTVHCTVIRPGQSSLEEEITVPFEVSLPAGPPPPPPPSGQVLPLIEIIAGTVALPGAPVTITLSGFKPFDCTLIHDEHAVGQSAILATFDHQSSCADTTQRWARSFGLGTFAEGDHPFTIQLTVNGPDSSHVYTTDAVVSVHNPEPPPPPIDSSRAGLSASHPNPFREQSSFSVSLDQAQVADVSVFDLLGRRVTTIHRGMLPQGTSNLAWNGRRADGSRAPGGIYFYRLTLEDRVVHRQVVLLDAP
jgi:hypothetical protein